jgi:hypothetical protein
MVRRRELAGRGGTTRLVRDIRPGTSGSGPADLFVHGGLLWFTADDGTTGTQLDRSDGTTAEHGARERQRAGHEPGRGC